jgi:hypothetical protein
MAIKIPGWVEKTGGWILSGVLAVSTIFLAANQNPQFRQALDDEKVYLFIGTDSTAIIKARRDATGEVIRDTTGAVMHWDTTKHATTENDLSLKLQRWSNPDDYSDSTYANGFLQLIFDVSAVSLLSGNACGLYHIETTPEIGTNMVMRLRRSRSEIATEKIPEKCEQIGAEKAAEKGWYPVGDTTMYPREGKSDSVVLVTRWTMNANAKPVKTIVEPVELESVEK